MKRKDWGEKLCANWEDIYNIFWRFLPMGGKEIITKDGIRMVCLSQTLEQYILKLKKDHDWDELHRYCFLAWDSAPDNRSIHYIPGWNVLCDLCSEWEG